MQQEELWLDSCSNHLIKQLSALKLGGRGRSLNGNPEAPYLGGWVEAALPARGLLWRARSLRLASLYPLPASFTFAVLVTCWIDIYHVGSCLYSLGLFSVFFFPCPSFAAFSGFKHFIGINFPPPNIIGHPLCARPCGRARNATRNQALFPPPGFLQLYAWGGKQRIVLIVPRGEAGRQGRQLPL